MISKPLDRVRSSREGVYRKDPKGESQATLRQEVRRRRNSQGGCEGLSRMKEGPPPTGSLCVLFLTSFDKMGSPETVC